MATIDLDYVGSGIVCDNTCLNYVPGDRVPDYLHLFGPAFGDLGGKTVDLLGSNGIWTLTIGGQSLSFSQNDPNYQISFTDPLLASFNPGAAMFTAIGVNPYGFAVSEFEPLCITAGVPEPSTWALMILGTAFLLWYAKKKRLLTNFSF
jgi:hypothetical protein